LVTSLRQEKEYNMYHAIERADSITSNKISVEKRKSLHYFDHRRVKETESGP